MRSRSHWIVIGSLVCAAHIAAQQPSGGLFPGTPGAMSVDGKSTEPGQMYYKQPGFGAGPPGIIPSSVGPSLDLAAILTACGMTTKLDIDALSMGCDCIQADDTTGAVSIPPLQWAALTLSVTASSVGKGGSRIAAETGGADGVGGDIFSYVLPGSDLPAPFVEQVELVNDSREMGLSQGEIDEVDAFDLFLPIYAMDPALALQMTSTPSIYFSVSARDIQDVPTFWWGGRARSGAVIFEVRYTGNGWSCPQPFIHPRELGYPDALDIDAVAIDLANERMLFSTTSPGLDEIMFYYFGNDGALPPVPYTGEGGTPISTEIGLALNDDVDAICAMDPTNGTTGGPPSPFFFIMGTPTTRLFPMVPTVQASAFRGYDGVNAYVESYMIGWPPTTGQVPGVALLTLTFEPLVSPLFQISPVLPRDVTPTFLGDPQTHRLIIPPVVSLTGLPVALRWFAVDAGLTEAAEAWPLKVNL